jgi:nitrous oxidase accessory protein NosD
MNASQDRGPAEPSQGSSRPSSRGPSQRSKRISAGVLALALVGGVGGAIWLTQPDPLPEAAELADPDVLAPEDLASGQRQAELVALEDTRVSSAQSTALRTQVRFMSRFGDAGDPVVLESTNPRTLVLSMRDEPYTLTELTTIPNSGVTREGNVTTLSSSVFVPSGATLELDGEVRLESGESGFSSIVSYGGTLVSRGAGAELDLSETAPLREGATGAQVGELLRGPDGGRVSVTSWDPDEQAPDTDTSDGRAYVRAVGGSVDFKSTDFSDLGFWSGRTGGVALTGIEPTGLTEEEALLAEYSLGAATGPGKVTGVIEDTSFDRGTYGLFLSASDDVEVRDSSASGNLLDGFTVHRAATGTALVGVTSSGNGSDGVSVNSGATGTVVSGLTSRENGERGMVLDGSPLAQGPSPSGEGVGGFAGTLVTNSRLVGNPVGVEVISGDGVALTDSSVTGGVDGVVVREGALEPVVSGNTISGVTRYGIMLRDEVTKAQVRSNTVSGAATGLYARDSQAAIEDNTVKDASNHGASVVGLAAGSRLVGNDLSGHGISAIDDSRVEETEVVTSARQASSATVLVDANETGEWSRPVLNSIASFIGRPLSLLWAGLLVLMLGTAFVRKNRAETKALRDPYSSTASLEAIIAESQRGLEAARK